MTEQEITHRIRRWEIYAELGNPFEFDYGSPKPREYGMASAERAYLPKGRNQWMTADELLAERAESKPTKDEYDLVERVYRTRNGRDRVTIAYYGACPPHKITQREHAQVMLLFRGDVGRAE